MSEKITIKQEKFVQAISSGMTQIEAYKTAYNARKSSDKTCREEACKIMKNPNVSTRLAELRQESSDNVGVTREYLIQEAISTYKEARGAKEYSAAVSALKATGDLCGYDKKTVELLTKGKIALSFEDFYDDDKTDPEPMP